MKPLILSLLLFGTFYLVACSKKAEAPSVLEASATQKLARYDLATTAYDVLPVTTFVLSWDSADRVSNVYEKSGQKLIFYSLSYTSNQLTTIGDNNLGTQLFTYDNKGRVAAIDYTTPTTASRRVFTYDNTGLLTAVLDSVKAPNVLPALTQYLFTYDNGNNNVIQITQNQLDLQHRPTLAQYNFYTYDDQPNPFTACPWLFDVTQLPGSIPALVNKNNILQTRIVGTIFHTSGGSSVPKLDTITNFISTRQYAYNTKGYPATCKEYFQDIQYNYSGNRSFTYDY